MLASSFIRSLIVSLLTLLWWNDACCLAITASSEPIGVPRSERQEYSKDDDHQLWNQSPQINEDGFLSKSYHRIPSELEVGEDAIEGIHHKSRLIANPVTCRQVPGDGNCLFHSLVLCLRWAEQENHYCYKDNYEELRRLSRTLREQAVDYLASKPNRKLYLQGDEYMRAKHLIEVAASPFNVTAKEYCEKMRQESYWGGGPEVVALCNLLRRPIHIYELCPGGRKQEFRFRRMAYFGSPRFDKKEALHILSADSRFPDLTPGKQLANGNHFLSLFPEAMTSKRKRRMRVRGGKNAAVKKLRSKDITPDIKEEEEKDSLSGILSKWYSAYMRSSTSK